MPRGRESWCRGNRSTDARCCADMIAAASVRSSGEAILRLVGLPVTSRAAAHRFHGLGFVGGVGGSGTGERARAARGTGTSAGSARYQSPSRGSVLALRPSASLASVFRPRVTRAGRPRRRAGAPAAAASRRCDRCRAHGVVDEDPVVVGGVGPARAAHCGRSRARRAAAAQRRDARPRADLRRRTSVARATGHILAAAERPRARRSRRAPAGACPRASSIAWASRREAAPFPAAGTRAW